jgi:hypothetical protein
MLARTMLRTRPLARFGASRFVARFGSDAPAAAGSSAAAKASNYVPAVDYELSYSDNHYKRAEELLNTQWDANTLVDMKQAWAKLGQQGRFSSVEVEALVKQMEEVKEDLSSNPIKLERLSAEDVSFVNYVDAFFRGKTPNEAEFQHFLAEYHGNGRLPTLDDEGFNTKEMDLDGNNAQTVLSDKPEDWETPNDIPVHMSSNQDYTIVKMNGEAIYIPQIARSLEWATETPTELHLFNETPVIYEATTSPPVPDDA